VTSSCGLSGALRSRSMACLQAHVRWKAWAQIGCESPLSGGVSVVQRAGLCALISERTKAALRAAKRKGRKLGTAGSVETAARARAARSEQASKANATTALAVIARELKSLGVRTPGRP